MPTSSLFQRLALGFTGLILAASACAQEAVLRKVLAERLPNFPPIEEVRATNIPGIYEVRVNGTDLIYADAKGDFLIQGELIDVKAKRNLTKERVDALSAVDFKTLPIRDAFTMVRGNGKRKMAVFEDPNCGYCKRFEGELQKLNNVTIYMFLIPILGDNSVEKSKAIWCAKDKAKVWQDWMLRNVPPPAAKCDTSALERNLAFSRKARISGTPAAFFPDGTRIPGMVSAAQMEEVLAKQGK